jgi:hypothetical protein
VDLLVSVVAGRPDDVGTLVSALRKGGREREVEPVLAGLATGASDSACAVLLDCLVKDGTDADVSVLIGLLSRRSFASMAAIASTVDAPEAAAMLVPALLAAPGAEQAAYFTSAQAQLSSSQRGRLASLLVASAPHECPEDLLIWYAGWADPSGVVWLVEQLGQARIPLDPVLAAVAGRRDFATLREALHRLGSHQLSYRLAGLRSELGL